MRTRGRRSSSDLAVLEPVDVVPRPDAPYDLTDEEADEWRGFVNSMPADHFPRCTYPLLTQLCRHLVAARRLAQLIEQVAKQKNLDPQDFARLLRAQAQESAVINRLLRSMRLTQQATSYGQQAKLPKTRKSPWDAEVA